MHDSHHDEGALACTTPDGIELALIDFGGRGPDLLLVHATGLCGSVLRPLAASLRTSFHCWGLDLRGHGRSGRPSDGTYPWATFGTDVLSTVDYLGLDRPFGFGHSCGGASLLLAEEARPGTFAGLYCFEPVMFPDGTSSAGPSADLAAGARRRRDRFPSRSDALANFGAKAPMSLFDPEALRAYVDDGFEVVPAADGGDGQAVRLRCRREDEATMYENGRLHGAYDRLGAVECPVTLACGEQTDSFGPPFLERYASRLARPEIRVFADLGHFGPLEGPGAIAGSVRSSLVPDPRAPRS